MNSHSGEVLLTIAVEVLRGDGRIVFTARGRSMSPLIRDGDTVTLAPPDGRIRIGDVILFRDSLGRPVLHRVIRKTPTGVITRGDACLEQDGITAHYDILGRVVDVSGRGFRFHLRAPYKYLFSNSFVSPACFNDIPFLSPLFRMGLTMMR